MSVQGDGPMHDSMAFQYPIDQLRGSMLRKLRQNSHKKDWSEATKAEAYYFLTKLREEVEELEDALKNGDGREIMDEAADICNFALFVHELARKHGRVGEP